MPGTHIYRQTPPSYVLTVGFTNTGILTEAASNALSLLSSLIPELLTQSSALSYDCLKMTSIKRLIQSLEAIE